MNSEWDNIKEELRGAEAPLSSHAWDDMNTMLDINSGKKNRKAFLWFLPALLVGVCTLFVFTQEPVSTLQVEAIENKVVEKDKLELTNTKENENEKTPSTETQKTKHKTIEITPEEQFVQPVEIADSENSTDQETQENTIPKQEMTLVKSELNPKAYPRVDSSKIEMQLVDYLPLETPEEVVQESTEKNSGWDITVYAGPTYNIPNVKYVEEENYTHKNLATATEDPLKGGWGMDAGVELSYRFNSFFKLSSGLGYRKITTQNDYQHRENEIPVLDSTTQKIVGYISLPALPEPVKEAQSTNEFVYIGVPVSLFYEHKLNTKWSLTGEFKNSFNFLVNQNSYLVNSQSLTLESAAENTFNPMVVSYQFRLGLRYRFNKNIATAFEPAFRGHYNNIYNSTEVIWKPQDFSFNLALIYTFK